MCHAVNRRRFVTAAAGSLLATLPVRPLWPVQATAVRRGTAWSVRAGVPRAICSARFPRLLELASVPCLALATVDAAASFPRTVGPGVAGPAARCRRRHGVRGRVARKAALRLRGAPAGGRRQARPRSPTVRLSPRARGEQRPHAPGHRPPRPHPHERPAQLAPATRPARAGHRAGRTVRLLRRRVLLSPTRGRTGDRSPIARLLREDVLDPLGMSESSWVWRARVRRPDGGGVRRGREAGGGVRGDRAPRRGHRRGMAEADRGVALRGRRPDRAADQPGVAGAAGLHGAERRRLTAHDRAGLRPLPRARGRAPRAWRSVRPPGTR